MPVSRPTSVASHHQDGVTLPMSPSSAISRPLHNESSRPTSRASSHRSSSRATNRPLSSASIRPKSRTGHGPPSKFSQRLPSRQISRITPLCHTLVSQVTGLQPQDEEGDFRALVDIVIRSLDYHTKAAPSSSMNDIVKQFQGRTERARVNSQDPWADALEHSLSLLKSAIEKIHDIDSEITPAHLPNHLMFLILLSVPPTPLAVEHAERYLEDSRAPRTDTVSISWKRILDEEPFEGQHWEGVYGLPPGSTVEGWETRSLDSTPPYSPLLFEDLSDRSPSLSSIGSPQDAGAEASLDQDTDSARMTMSNFGHRQLIEDLQRRQYWRTDWQTDAPLTSSFTIKNAPSLGPYMDLMLGERNSLKPGVPWGIKYIHEHDAIREILMACQGYKNSFLIWAQSDNGTFSFEPTTDAPRIIHLTKGSQLSATQPFAQTASTVEHLRRFVTRVSGRTAKLNPRVAGHSRRVTRTMEAFSEAVEIQIGLFNSWCATRERDIILSLGGNGPPLTVSFLNLEKTLRDSFSRTFDALLDVLEKVMSKAFRSQDKKIIEVWMLLDLPTRFTPFTISTLLLDVLLTAANSSSSNGDTETSKALMQVFSASVEPMWTMIGLWLKHGMPTQDPALRQEGDTLSALDDEFFIQDNGLSMLDPDFWTEGFTTRDANPEAHTSESAPLLLGLTANHVLRAGKAVGLLRILDLPLINDASPEYAWMADWPTFTALLHEHHTAALVETSKEHLSRFVHDIIFSRCLVPQKRLAQMASSECDLWLHLTAIEELYFMKKGDAMSYFSDTLFAKMDSGQTWSDFHFLNNTFRDTLKKYSVNRIEPTLVRFSYTGSRDKASRGTVDALSDLLVEYATPFPLTYIFGLHTSGTYRSVFIFLLQIRRAKNVLEGAHVREFTGRQESKGNAYKIIFAMRSKLIWFINTLLNFLATHVLHRRLLSFQASLKIAESLDEMISLHDSHLQKVESECLLQNETSALRQAILSILDMTLRFRDALTADVDKAPAIVQVSPRIRPRLHRSRREKQGRRGAIGSAVTSREATEASDSETDLEEEEAFGHSTFGSYHYRTPSMPQEGQQPFGDIYEMQVELDKLVRFVRREVEGLAGSLSGAASAFSVLAFALEDWDRRDSYS